VIKEETSNRQIVLNPPARKFEHPLDLVLAAASELMPDVVTIETNRAVATFRRVQPVRLAAHSAANDQKGGGGND
jgi:hypothetical protein